jgi:hypothetical protein
MYLMICTRPDLAFTLSRLSKFSSRLRALKISITSLKHALLTTFFMYGLSPGELVPSFDRRWRPGVGGEVVEGQCIQSPAYGPRQLPYPACPCAIIHTCSTYPHPAYPCSPAQPQVGMQNHHQRVRPLILLTAVDPQRQPCLLEPMSLVTVKSQNINTLKLR